MKIMLYATVGWLATMLFGLISTNFSPLEAVTPIMFVASGWYFGMVERQQSLPPDKLTQVKELYAHDEISLLELENRVAKLVQ